MNNRPYPKLLTIEEEKDLLEQAEWLWEDLDKDDLGGYSGINRPFYIVSTFREIIERFGHRDTGFTWSKNDLDAVKPFSGEWKPIETAPEGEHVLLFTRNDRGEMCHKIGIKYGSTFFYGACMIHDITHWMPLPSRPKD